MTTPFMGHKFKKASDRMIEEKIERQGLYKKLLTTGVNFLDRLIEGILPGDVVLLGAPSGVGKTGFCVNMALSNVRAGKKVHFIALEAEENEIERRIKFNMLCRAYFGDQFRMPIYNGITFRRWKLGMFEGELEKYEPQLFEQYGSFENLHTFYKDRNFGIDELVESVYGIADQTDLIIIDHAHYFDFDDDNENRALKNIAKTVRTVGQVIKKPIVLVAHLRKRDKRYSDLVPSLDDFHGSSDLTKIPTLVITLARGELLGNGRTETYVRVPKCRDDGLATFYVGRLTYSAKVVGYEDEFEVGRLVKGGTEFESITNTAELPIQLQGRK